MPRKRKKTASAIPRPLLITCLLAGIVTMVLNMANRRLKIPELGEVAGWAGTVFVICLLLIIGIFAVWHLTKK